MRTSRRTFLGSTAAAGLTTCWSPLRGEEKRSYRTALIGSGWWGMNIFRTALESGECKPVAVCDVDERHLNAAAEEVSKKSGEAVKKYKDYRELLKVEKPEIVIVGTPDHWHPLQAIAAVEAGAHVYVEKPVGHTILEGRAMVKAARETHRVMQVGLHRRVSPHNVSGRQFIQDGRAGKVGMVRAFVHYPGGPGTATPDEDPPKELDWDLYCGPAPLVPYNKRIHPKGFRQFMNFANGQLGDWGVHWMDQILWITGETGPKRVFSTGGRFIKKDNTDAPDTQVVCFEFETFTAVWEHRHYAGNEAERTNVGCYFYGTNGTFHQGWLDGWSFYPSDKSKGILQMPAQLNQPDGQNIRELWADFLSCIKNGGTPVADIEKGHRSTTMSLLGMLSLKVGRAIQWDAEKERCVGDDEANKLLKSEYRKPWKYPKY